MRNTKKYIVGEVYHGYGDIKGIDFTLLRRKDDLCLFERSDGYFELVRLRHQKYDKRKILGKEVIFEEKEIYPYGDSWDGKCIKSYDKALEIFKQ